MPSFVFLLSLQQLSIEGNPFLLIALKEPSHALAPSLEDLLADGSID